MRVEALDGKDAEWERVVAESVNGTFLHTRRYLAYHGTRFTDASLLVRDQRGRAVGVLPAALHPHDARTVVSHPGLTYGGLVHDGSVRGIELLGVLEDACAYWKRLGCLRLRYKAVPAVYHRVPGEDDRWALFRLGATHARCDLSTSIDLTGEIPRNRNRRRNIQKAQALGLRVLTGSDQLARFWPILTANLLERFDVAPVHSLEEITLLAELFPDAIRCDLVLLGDEPVGGVVLYVTERVWHPQYSAASPRGRECFALDAGFQVGIVAAREAGARWYDFGASTERQGHVLNRTLYQFKTSFGGGGVTYDQFDVSLV